ncbi:acyloxyacyl hydrolase [Thalassospira xiamenensis]|uniref:acyloxyacyl hydrolase n=1 Tax=Thalassospira xiamenensis TaxID=220697 RepID=UPI000DED9D80|nr:acyloxyacyl hydrolase [Thalassospira xiamenensis]RCK42306.1 deacylase [Thalassospira xiamenensis]
MRLVLGKILALLLVAGFAGAANAQQFLGNNNDSGLLEFSTGMVDITQDDEAAEFRLDYRFQHAMFGVLRPITGVMVTSDKAAHGYGGLAMDVLWGDHFVSSIYTSVGAYHQGDGEDLGHWIEFRSGLELGFRFDSRERLSLGIAHISNASIGDENPGTEILSLTYAIPIDAIFE